MNKVFEEIYQVVWQEIFSNIPLMDLEKFKQLYTQDLNLPQAFPCSLDPNQQVFSSSEYGYKKFISREAVEKRVDVDNWVEPKVNIASLADVRQKVQKIATFHGSRQLNSDVLEASDDIYTSSYIFGSTHIYSSQKMMFCYNNKESEFLLASKGNGNCSFGIRLHDSGSVSNSFDIHWCGKSANCYFCHDCYDLRDCMFCFHLNSKQYCIANMQFEKEEYEKLKTQILQEYFQQIDQPGGFKTLTDL